MRDQEVVAAIVAGDPAGLAEAYDKYAEQLYRFCRAMLREPADAADVVHDTFVIAASRLSGLRDPERLRSWLYAVADNECLRILRNGNRHTTFEAVAGMADEAVDIAADAERAELRAMVRDALSGLGLAEREVLELQVRHGLTNGEVATILGVSRNHLHALLSRARGQLEASLAVLAVARTGRRDCPALGAMLQGWDGRLTTQMRRRVSRHMRRCLVCTRRRYREMTPAKFLGALPLGALPLAVGLRDQVLRAAAGHLPAAAHQAAVARTVYTFGATGFPRHLASPGAQWWRLRPVHVSALAGTVVAATSVATVVALPPRHAARPAVRLTVTAASTVSGTPRARVAPIPASVTPGTAVPVTGAATTSPPRATVPAVAVATSSPASATLSVGPATLDVAPPGPGVISLTASGGPVDWSVWEPPGLAKKVTVSPTSGTLAAGATTTVTVTVTGHGHMHVHLVFSPGGTTVTVVVG
ncbi:MAG: sigma-70 family RNA polymerase sigma factor [Trebonia sp.]